MSVTPCDCSSLSISSLSQSTRGRHLMTPLQLFNVLCGLAVTGQPAKLSNLLRQRLMQQRLFRWADHPCRGVWLILQYPLGIWFLCPQQMEKALTVDCRHPLSGWQTTCHMGIVFVVTFCLSVCLRWWCCNLKCHIGYEVFNTLALHRHGVPAVLLPEERGTRWIGLCPASYSYGGYKGVIAEWRGSRRVTQN